jgi:hypothetical protein
MTRNQMPYVLRTVLIERVRYLEHLRASRAHDGSSLSDQEIGLLNELPEWFWMVEISLPQLYTGNRSKLGEVLINANQEPDPADIARSVLAVRLPSILIRREGSGAINWFPTSMMAHSPIFLHRGHTQVW